MREEKFRHNGQENFYSVSHCIMATKDFIALSLSVTEEPMT